MDKVFNVLNELMVDIFNDILTIEQTALQEGSFSDISVTEIHTLEAIGMYRTRTMSEVSATLGITIGTLSVAINNLVKKDYVERKRTDIDRRVVNIQLTKRGKLAFRIHEKFHSDMIKATIDGLTDEENVILVKSLAQLNDFFKINYNLIGGKKKEQINEGS
ncbi:MAG: winged helix-turn-helix transcriptional regulator [Clostridiaceae bacterium]|nr:winged helix-turn-helix transcriptional regulator [Clostridiaceae bacterium]